jgi:hypothetical protein
MFVEYGRDVGTVQPRSSVDVIGDEYVLPQRNISATIPLFSEYQKTAVAYFFQQTIKVPSVSCGKIKCGSGRGKVTVAFGSHLGRVDDKFVLDGGLNWGRVGVQVGVG